jgi:hypothetical protein
MRRLRTLASLAPTTSCMPTTSCALALALMTLVAGCGSDDPESLITRLEPVPGATAVDRQIRPVIELTSAASWDIDAGAPQLLLFDVTGGAKQRVGGTIEIEGQRATYIPASDLRDDHDFLLVLERSGVAGLCAGAACSNDEVLENDASEWPPEKLSWPLEVRFSTRSRPAVRGVGLDGAGRLTVRFSQPMDQVVTSPQFSLRDQLGQPVTLGPAVWIDKATQSARLAIDATLEPTELYTLRIERQAQGADGTRLDGDGDGEPGEIDDFFQLRFTGSQRPVVLSRYPQPVQP